MKKIKVDFFGIADLTEICDCALTLSKIEGEAEPFKPELNRTEYELTDKVNIWDWYFNQRGGSCNGY